MVRASLLNITKELTEDQRSAHNSNYNNLADKDMEIFYELDAKIQDAHCPDSITDEMVGSRLAVDPNSENPDQPDMFTGSITQWFQKLSERIVSIAAALNEKGGRIPNGCYLGVLDSTESAIYLPVVLNMPAEQSAVSPAFFFRVGDFVYNAEGVTINFSCRNEATGSFVAASSILIKPGEFPILQLNPNTLYVLNPRIVDGVYRMYAKPAESSDFINY
ncbi:MAG: hypothetical protein BWY15_01093 [Firmicutes bacterium ADurb.Bin193]|nr:MAG: hypothetical protein BWY15_01093 [Firmicutes bacterium ADurb.Bin193]